MFLMIQMLKRWEWMSKLMIMVEEIAGEIRKYFTAISLLLLVIIAVQRLCQRELKHEQTGLYEVLKDVFDVYMGNQDFEEYTYPGGMAFVGIFVFTSQMLLANFLISMFNNRSQRVLDKLDFMRRKAIINLKNSQSFDSRIGAITISFFPINIVLLPFMQGVLQMQSERLNDSILKAQFVFLIMLYILVIVAIVLPLFPLIYLKVLFNGAYHAVRAR